MESCRAGWTVDYHFSPFFPQREKFGFRDGFDGDPRLRETGTALVILGGDFNASFMD